MLGRVTRSLRVRVPPSPCRAAVLKAVTPKGLFGKSPHTATGGGTHHAHGGTHHTHGGTHHAHGGTHHAHGSTHHTHGGTHHTHGGTHHHAPKGAHHPPAEVSVKTAKMEYDELLNSLPRGPYIVHRGMSGFKEVVNIATDGRFGAGLYAKRPFDLDIAKYIHVPKSCALFSMSPDPHTVREYMVGFQLISAKGAIASTCLPCVYIRPQTARHVDVEAFQCYQKLLIGEQEAGEFRRVEDIFDLAQGNNETTAILGARPEDDWRLNFDTDLHSMVIVEGAAGRFLKGFAKAEQVHATTIVNPSFCQRMMAIEVASTATGEGAYFHKQFDKMNKRARELELIAPDSRILVLSDASTLMGSAEYRALIEGYTATEETMVLKSVPKEIPIGSPALLEYARFLIESNPKKVPIAPTGTSEAPTL